MLLIGFVFAPGVLFLLLAVAWLTGWTPREKFVTGLTRIVYSGMVVACAALAMGMVRDGSAVVRASMGNWFEAGEYAFPLALVADWLSLPMAALTVILGGIVTAFSARYLHRDRGFFRFFLLLHLFTFGALLAFTASSYDLMLGGWELVGITSVLLIAFFDERREPVRNSIRVFATYRLADLGLLLAIFGLHYTMHTAEFADLATGHQTQATTIGLLLMVAAAGKSAQFPFFGWLPRAMEGPTPSSAIFYGAISVHLGAYLLLRSMPILEASPWASGAVLLIGAQTALIATLIHRVSTDAKTSLAYAAMAQLGIVFVEIALGYPKLALAHMLGHAAVRTLQFLRAPSMLHDYHRVHAAAGGHLGKTGLHYERILPEGVRAWLYRAGLERGYYDALADRLLVGPVTRLARWAAGFEPDVTPPNAVANVALKEAMGRVATVWPEAANRVES